jgi:hypothetical protein
MKYEFYVGNYVEMKEGGIGYISKMQPLSNGHICLYVHFTDDKIYSYNVVDSQLEFRFNRIGQYDFTKKDEGKIEPLPENYTMPYIIHVTSLEEDRIIDIGDISKKINELVEAVNRIDEKVNEMA